MLNVCQLDAQPPRSTLHDARIADHQWSSPLVDLSMLKRFEDDFGANAGWISQSDRQDWSWVCHFVWHSLSLPVILTVSGGPAHNAGISQ
jgi:hypothetical protein